MPSVAQHLAKQETAKLVDAVDKKCFVMNKGFGPAIGEALPFKTKDAVECQKELRSSAYAKHFVFTPMDGECRLVGPEATPMPAQNAISGPKVCEELAVQLRLKADFKEVGRAVTRRLVIFVGIPSAFMIAGLIITGAVISVRRRLRLSMARTNLFARNELLAGGVPRLFPTCLSKIQFVAKDLDWRISTSLSKFGSCIAIDTLWYYTAAMGWQLSSR
eukprot:symbB.v1.2.013025.t1/scaffold913.1/size152782/3